MKDLFIEYFFDQQTISLGRKMTLRRLVEGELGSSVMELDFVVVINCCV